MWADPFADADDWYKAMGDYTKGVFPGHLLEKRLDVRGTPMWVLVRNRPVLEVSQLRKRSSAV